MAKKSTEEELVKKIALDLKYDDKPIQEVLTPEEAINLIIQYCKRCEETKEETIAKVSNHYELKPEKLDFYHFLDYAKILEQSELELKASTPAI